MDFARTEGGDEAPRSIDLSAMLSSICDNASSVGLPASYRWNDRLISTCRPMALKRALTNLVENAARYGGEARVSSQRLGTEIRIVIEDDGPGIPESHMERVFDAFTRIEDSRNRKSGGIGLGLTVARTIIRAHGGDILLANRPEGGLGVTVILPEERKR